LRSWPAAGKAKELFFPFAVLRRYAIIALVFKKSIFFSKLLARALSPLKALSDACYWKQRLWELSKFIQKTSGPHQRLCTIHSKCWWRSCSCLNTKIFFV
jgi:hypothetical protein